AFELLKGALKKSSWNDVIRCGAIAGFAELADARAIPVVLEWTKYGKPNAVRRAAIAALGKLGEGRKDVRDAVIALLDDRSLMVRITAVGALEALHDLTVLPALEAIANADVDGRLKRRSAEAVRALRELSEKTGDVKQLRDEIAELKAANRSLSDRLEFLESNSKVSKKRKQA
ncbi:MAG TPA: HEAT repeat domain-containing protein, partial [Candidatus Eremiobacteraceae bacterium]|nr:HEAT repeat domain-containing protein [Candidatus Eremiobacteraceae bacterium]